ncbi:hypothetical protein BASA62_006620 [Batrachochytrium salamandrivorans]|nr:hypothetical protein BASA62_006620 [Batrachochytrium salamandrivorans]
MAKTSKKSKVKITGPKYDSGTEESDDSDSDSEGEYVFGGYDESENENNKPENDNNPKSGTSGSDAETAGEKSGDKVTGSGDDTGAGDDDEVKLEGGAKGGESKAEDDKLEDGAAKPENDRGSCLRVAMGFRLCKTVEQGSHATCSETTIAIRRKNPSNQ